MNARHAIDAKSDLEELARLLEECEEIPSSLAKRCAKLIRDALATGGKLIPGRTRGQPRKDDEKLIRACEVALLRGKNAKMKVDEAVNIVSRKNDRTPSMIEKDYKKFGKRARLIAEGVLAAPDWNKQFEELIQSLKTFRHDNGMPFTDKNINDIVAEIPSRQVGRMVSRINNGPLRRNKGFLREILPASFRRKILSKI